MESSETPKKLDDKEFKEKLKQVRPRLLRFAIQSTHNEADGDEAIQETMIKAWGARNTFDYKNDSSFYSWLKTILTHTMTDLWRAEQGRKDRAGASHEDVDGADDENVNKAKEDISASRDKELGDALDQRRTVQRVLSAIEELPRRQREVMEKRALEKTGVGSAVELGTNAGTGKRNRFRGRRNLAKKLGPEEMEIVNAATTEPKKVERPRDTDKLEP